MTYWAGSKAPNFRPDRHAGSPFSCRPEAADHHGGLPFSLIDILPAHRALNALFTATAMVGFIAGAGVVVRNSSKFSATAALAAAMIMPSQK